ncbi:hypothetical protein BP6252_02114 [Coleophoma cylindrospora]|uniref:BTB domain-containing protein n=1 Tax=Coleophoma cylindrospora TaxID=1849047 RepID=A0A3D8SEJ3_9HELO|nr:hypothetical protein BP6252_02114 [Coleophoma cylindrospora]
MENPRERFKTSRRSSSMRSAINSEYSISTIVVPKGAPPASRLRAIEAKPIRPVSELIHVGPKRKLWVLNEDLLCDRSTHFSALFQGPSFRDVEDKEIWLDDDDVSAFGLFVDWIYGSRDLCSHGHAEDIETEVDWDNAHFGGFSTLYVLADKYGITDLRDAAVEQYAECSEKAEWLPGVLEINFIYQNTAEGSRFRSVVIQNMVRTFVQGYTLLDSWAQILCYEKTGTFASDVAKALKEHVLLSKAKECSIAYCTTHNN